MKLSQTRDSAARTAAALRSGAISARSQLSSRALEAEGALERIKRMMVETDEAPNTQQQDSAAPEPAQTARAAGIDHMKLRLNYESPPETFHSPEWYFFMADRELLEDQHRLVQAQIEDMRPELELARNKALKLDFTEKERDELISQKRYLLRELQTFSVRPSPLSLQTHNYEAELASSTLWKQKLQQPIDYLMPAPRATSGGGGGGHLQKEYAGLKKQLENTEHQLAEAKFKMAKLVEQLQDRSDQLAALQKANKVAEKQTAEKASVLKHLRLELDRMHTKSSAEIKKLKKQLELAEKARKAPASLNSSMAAPVKGVAGDGNNSMFLTPEPRHPISQFSTFRSTEEAAEEKAAAQRTEEGSERDVNKAPKSKRSGLIAKLLGK